MSFLLVVILLALYFLPTIVAGLMRHRQFLAIGVLNALLGWTLIGWVAGLVWSLIRERQELRTGRPAQPRRTEQLDRYP